MDGRRRLFADHFLPIRRPLFTSSPTLCGQRGRECNRTGFEASPLAGASGIQFWGSSQVLGPQGEIIAEGNTDNPEVLFAELDMQRSEHVRRIWPFLRDRRIDDYQDLLKRYRD